MDRSYIIELRQNVALRIVCAGYAAQIPVGDRWAIVSYVRALQLSQINPGATP